MSMKVKRLGGRIGAQVDGVDIGQPLAGGVRDQVLEALWEHQVLFFRNQPLSDDEHLSFAKQFGQISSVIGNPPLSFVEDDADKPPMTDEWHTDATCTPEPPAVAFLSALDIPEYGGDTIWASLYAAYDALSPTMRKLCESLTVHHSAGKPTYREMVAKRFGREESDRRIGTVFAEHPLVVAHPVTGRPALYLSERFAESIVGMHPDESDALLGYLTRLIADQNLQVRWRWMAGDLAMWDEASTNHRAMSDHFPQHRLMRRCTIEGDRPVAYANDLVVTAAV